MVMMHVGCHNLNGLKSVECLWLAHSETMSKPMAEMPPDAQIMSVTSGNCVMEKAAVGRMGGGGGRGDATSQPIA